MSLTTSQRLALEAIVDLYDETGTYVQSTSDVRARVNEKLGVRSTYGTNSGMAHTLGSLYRRGLVWRVEQVFTAVSTSGFKSHAWAACWDGMHLVYEARRAQNLRDAAAAARDASGGRA